MKRENIAKDLFKNFMEAKVWKLSNQMFFLEKMISKILKCSYLKN